MIHEFVQSLEKDLLEYIQYNFSTEESSASFLDWPAWIPVDTRNAFKKNGIELLYQHQFEALKKFKNGDNLVLATATSSGKSLVYQVPILNSIAAGDEKTTLLLYPTKALARDQFHKLLGLFANLKSFEIVSNWLYATPFDGDTPTDIRGQIQANGKVIFTNPDMLHHSMLPNHHKWSEFFKNLDLIVLEEIHQYNGVFGSHLSYILQRLNRICRHYGSTPRFIGTSASIHNPDVHMSTLIQSEATAITQEYSPKNEKLYFGINPLIIDLEFHVREHPYNPIVKISKLIIAHNIQTIIFCSSRRSVEMLYKVLLDNLMELGLDDKIIIPYRSGYTKSSRREKEDRIRSGDAIITVATNALELGIDIQGVDAIITLGYPGSIASIQQQAGRAGRKHQTAIHIFVASQSPIDQYIINNPDWMIRNPETARINRENLLIALPHIQSNLYELPYNPEDIRSSIEAPHVDDVLEYLINQNLIQVIDGNHYWIANQRPHDDISIRSTATDQVELIDSSNEELKKIGDCDLNSAIWMTHTGAVYHHDGVEYLVDRFDSHTNRAYLKAVEVQYATRPDTKHEVQIISSQLSVSNETANTYSGELQITTYVDSYRKIDAFTGMTISRENIDMPSIKLQTTGIWIIPNESVFPAQSQPSTLLGEIYYGENWEDIRKSIRLRDGFRCIRCGLPEKNSSHHVHHKIPARNFDSIEEANQYSNLVTLCPTCHRLVETAVRIRSPLGGLTYALQNILPIYVSAARYDVIARAVTDQECFGFMPTLMIYDNVPGGLGMSYSLLSTLPEVFDAVYSMIDTCQCENGCPACIGAPGEIGHGNKQVIKELITSLKMGPIK